ncbi:MAG: hypothetical protein HKN23_17435 [Verrucomicrobiales bacterium]|nr:hypothetical protein [Verrucomicrobiales bacterium]
MRNLYLLPIAAALVAGIAISTAIHADDKDELVLKPQPLDNMHHLMEYVFEPSWKRLKVSMAEEVMTKEGWKAIKGDALTLAESTNLLFHRLPDENQEDWKKIAAQTRKEGADFYQAARAKDYPLAVTKYKALLTSCNQCHDKFADGEYQLEPWDK